MLVRAGAELISTREEASCKEPVCGQDRELQTAKESPRKAARLVQGACHLTDDTSNGHTAAVLVIQVGRMQDSDGWGSSEPERRLLLRSPYLPSFKFFEQMSAKHTVYLPG